jgi:rfaE bifunctional protein nucleotidyltransferase chain/domain
MTTPVIARADLLELRAHWRRSSLRCALTNGVFDLLHAGHVSYLQAARAQADLLIVGLNSDASTRQIKGPRRPIVPATDRATVLAALRCVDYVTIFEEPTAERLVDAVRPEIYVKGADYAQDPAGQPDPQRLPEARIVSAYGGKVVLLPFAEGRSTTTLIERIVERYR